MLNAVLLTLLSESGRSIPRVSIFPGNKIPIFRGNADAKQKLKDLVMGCKM